MKKQEIWPWAIVLSLAAFVGGIVFAVMIMTKKDIPMVTEDYYAAEAHFDTLRMKRRHTLEAGLEPSIDIDRATGKLEIRFPDADEPVLRDGFVLFFRPSDDKMDFSVPLFVDEKGEQRVDLSGVKKGLWVVKIEWKSGEKEYAFEEEVNI